MVFKGKPKIQYIVIHHTAVSRKVQPNQRDIVNSYHKQKWGMQSELGYYGGYNFIVEPTGLRTQYRKIGEETVAQQGFNCDTAKRCTAVSYCFVGDFRVEKPTDLQVNDFRDFLTEVRKKYPNVMVVQHKDLQPNRTCAYLTQGDLLRLTKYEKESDIIQRQKQVIKLLIQLVALLTKYKK